MEEKSMMENFVDIGVAMVLMSLFIYGMMWASEKEEQLGINGMSSDRILVKDELANP